MSNPRALMFKAQAQWISLASFFGKPMENPFHEPFPRKTEVFPIKLDQG